MLEVTIHVRGLEKLADAMLCLAGVAAPAGASGMGTGIPADIPKTATIQPGLTATMSEAPVSIPGTGQAAGGMPMSAAIPTTAMPQVYTQDQIAVAMTGLSDQGRGAELVNILARFGVSSLVQVPKERYPELVLYLREAGAAI